MKRKFIRDQTGEGYVDVAITLLIMIAFIASMMFIYPIFTAKQSLTQSAKHITRIIELYGKADDTTINRLFEDNTLVIPDDIEVISEYENTAEKTIQLKTSFTVTVSKEIQIPVMRPLFSDSFSIRVKISSAAKGVSEVYWK